MQINTTAHYFFLCCNLCAVIDVTNQSCFVRTATRTTKKKGKKSYNQSHKTLMHQKSEISE